MRIAITELQCSRDEKFVVDRQNAPFFILQLFWTPIFMKFDGKNIVTPPQTLIILDKDTPHYFRGAEGPMINDYICFEAERSELEGLILNKPIPISNYEWYRDIIQCIHTAHNSVNTQSTQTTSLLFKGLLSKCKELFSYYSHDLSSRSSKPLEDSLVQLRNDILDFPQSEWSISKMARQCNLSISHFEHSYKELFSVSPIIDVINARILKAKKLLTTPLSIKEIATNCGYTSDVHFMNQFKKFTGESPSTYRKKLNQ